MKLSRIIRYTKSPAIIGKPDEQGVCKEFVAHCLVSFGRRIFIYRQETGKKYRKAGEVDMTRHELMKPGSKVVYSSEDFTPYEYELIG